MSARWPSATSSSTNSQTQAKEGAENGKAAAAETDPLDRVVDFAPAVFEDFAIERGLSRFHLAIRDALGFGRQILCHVVLQPSKDEWAHADAQALTSLKAPFGGRRRLVALGKFRRRAQKPCHQKVENAPELDESVFQRGSGQRQPSISG